MSALRCALDSIREADIRARAIYQLRRTDSGSLAIFTAIRRPRLRDCLDAPAWACWDEQHECPGDPLLFPAQKVLVSAAANY